MNRSIICSCVCWALGIASASAGEAAVPAWKPEEALLAGLSPETTQGGFYIRPPKYYVLTEQPVSGGTKAFAWRGIKRPNKKSPFLLVVITPVPKQLTKSPSLDDLAKQYLDGVESQHEQWTQTEMEHGQIHGRTFVRAHWNGTERATKYKMSGFIYVAVAGREIIYLSSKDTVPEDQKSLPPAEAAALTFQWRQTIDAPH